MPFTPSQVQLGVTAVPIWGGQGAVDSILIYNQDLANTVYLGGVSAISIGGSNTLPLGPGQSVSLDAGHAIYACAQAGTAALIIIPGGSSFFQPSANSAAVVPPYRYNALLTGGSLEFLRTSQSPPSTLEYKVSIDANGNLVLQRVLPILSRYTTLLSGPWVTIPPSGDATGATDPGAIQAALNRGNWVQLTPGTYNLNAPIVIPGSNTFLRGAAYAPASTQDIYNAGGAVGQPGGTVINMVTAFAGDAAISFPDPGGAASQQYNVGISDLTINGNNITGASTIPGIHVTGAWGACVMEGVTIHRAPGDCIRFDTGTGGSIADDWYLRAVKCTGSRNGNGVTAAFLDDSWIDCCEFSENAVHGFVLSGGVNTRFIGSKAENNKTGHGWYFQGLPSGGQIVYMTGCSTHLNNQDGFHFDNAAGGAQGNYHLNGCHAQQDGQSGGAANAGFGSVTCKSRIMLAGCTCTTNVTGPAFGASAITTSFGVEAQMCLLLGVTAGTHDDASNTHVLSNTNAWAF